MPAAMTMSRQGLMELVGHEAIVLTRYKDSKGIWTIGVGHTKAAGPPDPRTFEGAMAIADVLDLYGRDLKKYIDGVNAVLKVAVSQSQFDAMVSFHFNTGGIARASFVKALNAGDAADAAKQIMNWNKPKEVIGRRRKEQRLFATGVYSNEGKATVYPADADGNVQWKKGKLIDLATV